MYTKVRCGTGAPDVASLATTINVTGLNDSGGEGRIRRGLPRDRPMFCDQRAGVKSHVFDCYLPLDYYNGVD